MKISYRFNRRQESPIKDKPLMIKESSSRQKSYEEIKKQNLERRGELKSRIEALKSKMK